MGKILRCNDNIRKASNADVGRIRKHLSSLDKASLEGRFGNVVTESFIDQYTQSIFSADAAVFICEIDGDIRGIGELRPLSRDNLSAEALFTVDAPFRDRGIGTALMSAAIDEASREGVREVFFCFDARNARMRRIAEKFHGGFVLYDGGDCVARIEIDAYPRFWRRAARLAAASAIRATGAMTRASGEIGRLLAFAPRDGGSGRSRSAGGA